MVGNVTRSAYFGQGGQAFDLNVEKVLEHWSVAFAIRELIANALDEQALSRTRVVTGTLRTRDVGSGTNTLRRTRTQRSAHTPQSLASSAWV
jgi:hypothetical protein